MSILLPSHPVLQPCRVPYVHCGQGDQVRTDSEWLDLQALRERVFSPLAEEKFQCQFVESPAYCPLVFKLIDEQHTWEGYHGAIDEWLAPSSLSNVPSTVHNFPYYRIRKRARAKGNKHSCEIRVSDKISKDGNHLKSMAPLLRITGSNATSPGCRAVLLKLQQIQDLLQSKLQARGKCDKISKALR
jgi:hypothetical protein